MVTDSSGQPFLMPFLGTYYYNGVPSYANMDAASLLEAIRKQMLVLSINGYNEQIRIINVYLLLSVNIISAMKICNVISLYVVKWMQKVIYQLH